MTRVDYGGSMGGTSMGYTTCQYDQSRLRGEYGGTSMGYTTCQYNQSRLRGEYGGGQYGLHHMSI